eukprot:4374262-Prymnesium_polylepis.1
MRRCGRGRHDYHRIEPGIPCGRLRACVTVVLPRTTRVRYPRFDIDPTRPPKTLKDHWGLWHACLPCSCGRLHPISSKGSKMAASDV